MLKRILVWLLTMVDVESVLDKDELTVTLRFAGVMVFQRTFDLVPDPVLDMPEIKYGGVSSEKATRS